MNKEIYVVFVEEMDHIEELGKHAKDKELRLCLVL